VDDLRGFDAVIHLAALSNDPISNRFETLTDEINHRASVKLAQLAKQAGCTRFTFASSCSVYGQSEGIASETSPVNPLTAYARSKYDTECALQRVAAPEFTISCLRFATACGSSPGLRLDLVLNDFVTRAMLEQKITILSDGTPWRPLIHVSDMARALEWSLHRDPAMPYVVANVGSNEWNYRVIELAEAVARGIPGVSISVNKEAPPDKRSYRVGFDLFNELAAERYRPLVSLPAAIEDLAGGLDQILSQIPTRPRNFKELQDRIVDVIRLEKISKLQASGILSNALEWVGASHPGLHP
jgi:nucleoside-diphosphate-sugar epimerase